MLVVLWPVHIVTQLTNRMSAMEGWILVCLILALPIQLVASKHLVHKHHHKRTTDSPPVCSDSEFSCDINRCIPRIWLCDSETDCADGTDEANCTIGCQYDQWRCHDGSKCIRDSWRCDGDRDCPDGSDETNCTTGCPSGEWRCHNGQRCINSNWLCDGDNDCYDSSDELNCTGTTTTARPDCISDQFACDNGNCITGRYTCDGDNDCGDGSDERNCNVSTTTTTRPACTSDEFQCDNGNCVTGRYVCDRDNDCGDGSDERNCTISCPSGEWRCHDGQRCINSNWLCDGDNDCYDHSDERNCTGNTTRPTTARPGCASDEFQCDNGNCVTGRYVCDRDNDCGDGSDERNCTIICPSGEWRCHDGQRCINSNWLCDGDNDCYDHSDELNCTGTTRPPTARPGCASDEFQCDNGNCVTGRYVCDRDNDCGDGSDERNCTITCGTGEWLCHDGNLCIRSNWICDGDQDCPDGSDERNCTSCVEGEFRCGNGRCVPETYVCDGDVDCVDGADEIDCGIVRPSTVPPTRPPGSCWPFRWQCDNGACVSFYAVCNGVDDCGDGSEETFCGLSTGNPSTAHPSTDYPTTTRPSTTNRPTTECPVSCNNGQCLYHESWICDGEIDCLDGSDELNCYVVEECINSTLGLEYRGQTSTTMNGRTCQRWDSQYPHEHSRDDQSQFPDAVYNEENYCRNPDHEGQGPWCYTTDPDVRWEYCGIPACEAKECKTSILGVEYRGQRSSTSSGRTCQPWDSQYPHEHLRNDQSQFPDAVYNEENYCRNPDHEPEGPWCYTTDPNVRWEYCGIPLCEDCKASMRGGEYRGGLATTVSGRTCQQWTSQYPHEHTRNDQTQFPGAVYNKDNFCRNPDGEAEGPWCYTTDPDKRWEYCDIPFCDEL